jgi:hypothetical protein
MRARRALRIETKGYGGRQCAWAKKVSSLGRKSRRASGSRSALTFIFAAFRLGVKCFCGMEQTGRFEVNE